MAGNAHASRHGHRQDCSFCKAARERIAQICEDVFPLTNPGPKGAEAMKRFVANCAPIKK